MMEEHLVMAFDFAGQRTIQVDSIALSGSMSRVDWRGVTRTPDDRLRLSHNDELVIRLVDDTVHVIRRKRI